MDDNSRIKIQYTIKIIVLVLILAILLKVRIPLQKRAALEAFTVKDKDKEELGDIVVDESDDKIEFNKDKEISSELDINVDDIVNTIKENVNYNFFLKEFKDYDLNLKSLTYMPIKYHNLNPPKKDRVIKTYLANDNKEIIIQGELLEILTNKNLSEAIVVSNVEDELFLAYQTFSPGKTVEIPNIKSKYKIKDDDMFFFVDNELYVSSNDGIYLIDIGKGGYTVKHINKDNIPGEVINISSGQYIYYIQDDTIKMKQNIKDSNSKDKELYTIDKGTTAIAVKDNVFYINNNVSYQNDRQIKSDKVNVYVKGGIKKKSVDALDVLNEYWNSKNY